MVVNPSCVPAGEAAYYNLDLIQRLPIAGASHLFYFRSPHVRRDFGLGAAETSPVPCFIPMLIGPVARRASSEILRRDMHDMMISHPRKQSLV